MGGLVCALISVCLVRCVVELPFSPVGATCWCVVRSWFELGEKPDLSYFCMTYHYVPFLLCGLPVVGPFHAAGTGPG